MFKVAHVVVVAGCGHMFVTHQWAAHTDWAIHTKRNSVRSACVWEAGGMILFQ